MQVLAATSRVSVVCLGISFLEFCGRRMWLHANASSMSQPGPASLRLLLWTPLGLPATSQPRICRGQCSTRPRGVWKSGRTPVSRWWMAKNAHFPTKASTRFYAAWRWCFSRMQDKASPTFTGFYGREGGPRSRWTRYRSARLQPASTTQSGGTSHPGRVRLRSIFRWATSQRQAVSAVLHY